MRKPVTDAVVIIDGNWINVIERPADRCCLMNPELRRRATVRCQYGPRDASTPTPHLVLARRPEASPVAMFAEVGAFARIYEAATVSRSLAVGPVLYGLV